MPADTASATSMPSVNALRTEWSNDSEPACCATATPAKTLCLTAVVAAAGSPVSTNRDRYTELNALPRIAVPNGPPTLFTAWSTADPTPLRSSESSTRAAEVDVDRARPSPIPAIAIQTATKTVLEPVEVVEPNSKPEPSSTNPAAATSLAPKTRTNRSAGTAPRTRPRMTGSSRRPEPMASAPRTPWKYCGIVNST